MVIVLQNPVHEEIEGEETVGQMRKPPCPVDVFVYWLVSLAELSILLYIYTEMGNSGPDGGKGNADRRTRWTPGGDR